MLAGPGVYDWISPEEDQIFDPVAYAESQQETNPYFGVDEFTAPNLMPGDLVYQLGNKTLLDPMLQTH